MSKSYGFETGDSEACGQLFSRFKNPDDCVFCYQACALFASKLFHYIREFFKNIKITVV